MTPASLQTSRNLNAPTTSEEYAYHSVRTDILTGRIAAGARIVQAEIAKHLGISVTPVREAIRRLQSEGLVEVEPHRGATVLDLTIANAREIYELRIKLEPMLIERTLYNINDKNIDELSQLCEQMDNPTNVSHFAELNLMFHDGLSVLDNSWLSWMIQKLRVAASPYVAYSLHLNEDLMVSSNAEHRKMLHAFSTHNVDAAKELTLHHLSATIIALEDAL